MVTYKYPRPALTTDALIFGFDEQTGEVKILLIKRKNEPFRGKWAIPGGFVDMHETVEECATRELQEETGMIVNNLEQFFVASKVDRDPRGRTVSVVFWAILPIDYSLEAADDAADLQWFSIKNIPEMAFDHDEIIILAGEKLKFRLNNHTIFNYFFDNQIIKQNIEKIKNFCK